MSTMTEKRIATMKARAADYETTFRRPLVDRIRELLSDYPDVKSPNWLSWEGARLTNITTSNGLRRWLSVL